MTLLQGIDKRFKVIITVTVEKVTQCLQDPQQKLEIRMHANTHARIQKAGISISQPKRRYHVAGLQFPVNNSLSSSNSRKLGNSDNFFKLRGFALLPISCINIYQHFTLHLSKAT